MQHIFARAMGWQDGAGDTQESQVLLPADNGEAGDSNHGQLTSLTEEDARPCVRFLATVPEEPEDDEESAGGHGDCMHEHPIGDATAFTGFCRDHRGKLQSVWELCEDVATDAQDGVEDEDEQVFPAAAGTVPARPQAQGQPLAETPWPADRIVSGSLELRGSATRRTSLDRKVECTIQNEVMTFYEPAETGTEAVVLAREQVSGIIVTIVLAQTRKFSICNPEDIDSTQVWCCARDQVKRDEWLAVLHRLGVDLYREDDDGQIRRVWQGVQAQPGSTDL